MALFANIFLSFNGPDIKQKASIVNTRHTKNTGIYGTRKVIRQPLNNAVNGN